MSVAALRDRYMRLGYEARRATVDVLSPYDDVVFMLGELNGRAIEAAATQWSIIYYDWSEILRRFNEPDRLEISMWTGDRLLALGLATTRTDAIWIEIVEGDPSPDCPLAGARLAILIQCCANYAQLLRKHEVRLEAKNESLAAVYEKLYGFQRVKRANNALYWFRRV